MRYGGRAMGSLKVLKPVYPLVYFLIFTGVLWAGPYDDLVQELVLPLGQNNLVLAVAELETEGNRSQGRFLADEISEAFIRAGISVVERRNVRRITEEESYQLSGAVAEDTVAELGQAVGADCMVFGTAREFTRPGYANTGIKIMVQLVDVSEKSILSSASVEVEKSDMTSYFRRRDYTGSAGYPDLLELRVGADLFRMERYSWSSGIRSSTDGPGLELGVGFLDQSDGFFAQGWEFGYNWQVQSEDGADMNLHIFSGGKRILVRIPLWRYMDSLSFLTHLYFGTVLSGRLIYTVGDDDRYFGIDLKAALNGGISFGAGESWNIFADYRYTPEILTAGFTGFGSDEINGLAPFCHSGHQLAFGVQLLP